MSSDQAATPPGNHTTDPSIALDRQAPQLRLRLGTRGSALARWQADWVASQLAALGIEVQLTMITTQGDASTQPLGAIGGQGLFTKEIQRALLEQRIDLAVHSLKDLPTEEVPGLCLAAVPPRESNCAVLVCRGHDSLDALPRGAHVGTGSLRRRAQLLYYRPDLHVEDIRGNLDTRLRKLDEGLFDALILAEAGLRRLGWEHRITRILPHDLMLPAVGQGALGIESRVEDAAVRETLALLDHQPSRAAVLAERALLAALRAGCLAPVGAWGRMEQGELRLDAVVLSPDGKSRLQASVAGPPDRPEDLGGQAARQLIAAGADRLIESARGRPIAS